MVAPITLTSWLYTAVQGHLWRHCPWVPFPCYKPHLYIVELWSALCLHCLVNTPGGHVRRRPSAPAFGLTGISLPCFLTGSDFRLIAVQLPVPLSPDGGRLSAMVSLTGSLIARLAAAQSAVVSADNQYVKELCCCPCGLALVCRLELHQRPPRASCAFTALSCLSYGRKGDGQQTTMRMNGRPEGSALTYTP